MIDCVNDGVNVLLAEDDWDGDAACVNDWVFVDVVVELLDCVCEGVNVVLGDCDWLKVCDWVADWV